MHQLAIIGGGPASIAAGVYAARKKISSVIIAESFGGQSIVSADVQNWIGTVSLSGFDLAQNLEKHLKAHKDDISILEGETVVNVEKIEGGFKILLKSGKEVQARYVFVGSGSRRRRLNIPGEDKFEGKGVAYCSICDAPLFKDKEVAVVGGGNAGLEAVIDLLPYASKIYLILRSEPKGDAVTLEKVKSDPKVEIISSTIIEEVKGDDFVRSAVLKNISTSESREIPLEGVFVEIGAVPNSEFVKEIVQLNERGEIVVDHKTQQASCPGIWAAGDVSDVLYKQNNISAGDAVKAVLNIYETLIKSSGQS